MICGLFSSFDPVVYSGSGFKWLMIGSLLVVLWELSPMPWGIHLFLKETILWMWIGSKQSISYPKSSFLLLMSVMYFFLLVNVSGLIPFYFALSSHFVINVSITLPLWIGGLICSIVRSFKSSMAHLVPLGSPLFLWPLLVYVELISLLIRPFTLSIRLMANVMAGHLILSLMGSFFSEFPSFGLLSSILIGGFTFFELCVSFVQAYVLTSLLTLYWEEASH